jgi:hypothetical protein
MNKMNAVSIKQAKDIIKSKLMRVKQGVRTQPTMLHGSPGLGKSAIIQQLATGMGFNLVDLRLSSIEATDIMGIPYVNQTTGVMVFSTPEWFPDGTSPTIIFLDEITNGLPPQQHAAYRLVLDRTISNGKKLPDNCYIIAAGNLVSDKTGARPILPALANRFGIHLFIDPSKISEGFLEFATEFGLHRDITGFCSFKRESVYQPFNDDPSYPTPRSWEAVNEHLLCGYDDVTLMQVAAGAVGTAAAVDFMAYRELNSKLPNWTEVRTNPTYGYELPVGDDAIMYAISTALAYELIDSFKVGDQAQTRLLSKFLAKFSDEVKILTIKALKRDSTAVSNIIKEPELLNILKQIGHYVVS